MANQFVYANFFNSELLSGIGVADTVISIPPSDSTKLPNFSSGFFAPLVLWDGVNTPEVVYVTNNPQTGALTVVRGQESTSAFGWAAGTQVRSAITAGVMNAALAAYNTGLVLIANYLPLTGGTLTGPLTLSGLPTTSLMAATKGYVDSSVAGFLPLAGGTMTGAINMNSQRIMQLPTPGAASDAATKGYVDALQNTFADRGGGLVTAGTGAAYTLVSNTGYGAGIPDKTQIAVRWHATNRANPTLAVDGTAAVSIRQQDGSGGVPPGVLGISTISILEYHSANTNWIVLDKDPAAITTAGGPNNYSVTTGLSIAGLDDGLELVLQINTASAGVLTLNADSLGNIPLRPASGIDYVTGALPQYAVLPIRYNGTTNEWIAKSAPPAPLANTSLSYSDLTNVGITVSEAANVMTVNLTNNSGGSATVSNPINLPFADPANGGLPQWAQVTAALSIATVVGASFGIGNNVPFSLYVAAFNNAGTVQLALSLRTLLGTGGTATIYPVDESIPQSTVAMTAGATSAGVWYTPAGVTLASKSFRLLARLDFPSGLATAGSYNAVPNIRLHGVGSKKPGELVQSVMTSSTTQATTTSATFAALTSGTTLSYTTSNPCNLQRVETQGSIGVTGSAAGFIQLVRGSTLLGNPQVINTTGSTSAPLYQYSYDQSPSGAVTYSYQGKTSSGTLSYPAASTGVTIEVKEIQA